MTHKENDDNVQPQAPAFVPRRRFEDEDLEDDDVKDDWEEEDEEPKPVPAPAPTTGFPFLTCSRRWDRTSALEDGGGMIVIDSGL